MKDNVAVSNQLIRSVQGLSLPEKRLLMLAVTKLEEEESIDQMLTVDCSSYAAMYSMEKSAAYKALRTGGDKLWERTLRLPDVANGARLRWVISSDYDTGSVQLRFHPDLDGHVFNLKSHFTRYLLSRAGDFKKLHTWRLFELIMQFRTTGKLAINIDKFKEVMEIPPSYKADFGLVRSKVIAPAIKEIKDKAGLPVKLTTEKEGRKISKLVFTFPTEQQTTLPIKQKAAAAKKATKKEAPPDNSAAIDAASKAAGEAAMAKLLKPQEKKSTV